MATIPNDIKIKINNFASSLDLTCSTFWYSNQWNAIAKNNVDTFIIMYHALNDISITKINKLVNFNHCKINYNKINLFWDVLPDTIGPDSYYDKVKEKWINLNKGKIVKLKFNLDILKIIWNFIINLINKWDWRIF